MRVDNTFLGHQANMVIAAQMVLQYLQLTLESEV